MIEELKTYMTVIETNSFTRAAERLHLSQPSVSVHIKRLEEHFGTTLIKRSNKDKTLYITETGKYLYKKAVELIKSLEDVQSTIQFMEETVAGKIKIGDGANNIADYNATNEGTINLEYGIPNPTILEIMPGSVLTSTLTYRGAAINNRGNGDIIVKGGQIIGRGQAYCIKNQKNGKICP